MCIVCIKQEDMDMYENGVPHMHTLCTNTMYTIMEFNVHRQRRIRAFENCMRKFDRIPYALHL